MSYTTIEFKAVEDENYYYSSSKSYTITANNTIESDGLISSREHYSLQFTIKSDSRIPFSIKMQSEDDEILIGNFRMDTVRQDSQHNFIQDFSVGIYTDIEGINKILFESDIPFTISNIVIKTIKNLLNELNIINYNNIKELIIKGGNPPNYSNFIFTINNESILLGPARLIKITEDMKINFNFIGLCNYEPRASGDNNPYTFIISLKCWKEDE